MVGSQCHLRVRVGVVDQGLFISQSPISREGVGGKLQEAVLSHARISCLHLPLANL